ncbi:MAG: hypothetical protein AAF340_05165 [Pseudomonadota bacterium]
MIIDSFLAFWNGLAKKNGKLKFRNRREAAEFVRRISNQSGGPNAKLVEMRRQYETVQKSRETSAEPQRGRTETLQF